MSDQYFDQLNDQLDIVWIVFVAWTTMSMKILVQLTWSTAQHTSKQQYTWARSGSCWDFLAYSIVDSHREAVSIVPVKGALIRGLGVERYKFGVFFSAMRWELYYRVAPVIFFFHVFFLFYAIHIFLQIIGQPPGHSFLAVQVLQLKRIVLPWQKPALDQTNCKQPLRFYVCYVLLPFAIGIWYYMISNDIRTWKYMICYSDSMTPYVVFKYICHSDRVQDIRVWLSGVATTTHLIQMNFPQSALLL